MNDSDDEQTSDERLVEALGEAAALADEERWAEAYELLLRVEPGHPEDPTLLCMLGVTASALGAEGVAYDFFRRCLAQEPEEPELLALAGRGIAASDDPDAERVLRLAALSAPQLLVTRLSYGAYLAREGLFETALTELEAARTLAPEEAEVRRELGFALFLAGRKDEGLEELSEALSLGPDDEDTQSLYGLALVEAGRGDEAAEQLRAASLEREEDWEIQLAAALAAAAEGWSDEAWAALARAELVSAADRELVREVEDLIEAGAEAAATFLAQEFAAPLLRARLLERR